MRILWSVNTLPPDAARAAGVSSLHAISWVDAMSRALQTNPSVTLAIAAPGSGAKLRTAQWLNIKVFVLPAAPTEADWGEILEQFRPDAIHVYGTERQHNLPLIRKYADAYPIIISLQGIITGYEPLYYGALSMREILRNYTLGDFITGSGILRGRKRFRAQIPAEQEMLRAVRFAEGRSEWDHALSARINPALHYSACPRMIREPFFHASWDPARLKEHVIFAHQGGYPIKGTHQLLEAVAMVRKNYPDVRLVFSGTAPRTKGVKARLFRSGYRKILEKRIRALNLEDIITYTGYLDAEALAAELSRASLFVLPSVIENAPNSLAEAMLVGTPCVSSIAGGTMEMLQSGKLGYLYRCEEPFMLAHQIETAFCEEQQTIQMADAARKAAQEKHCPERLTETLTGIYADAIQLFSAERSANE